MYGTFSWGSWWKRLLGMTATIATLATGCVSASIVRVNGLMVGGKPVAVERHAPPPGSTWRDEVKEDIDRMDAAPVIYPASDVLSAIGGGILTVAYFGHDMGQKVLDQMIPEGWTESGESLETACKPATEGIAASPAPDVHVPDHLGTSPKPPSADLGKPGPSPAPDANYGRYHLGNPPDPEYANIWTPFPRDPTTELPPNALCTDKGDLTGTSKTPAFCGFGRLALQPGQAPLVIVLHGLFDSSNQIYVRQVGAILYSLGYSVFLMDLRDHGDTFRKWKDVGWALGDYEGADIVRAAQSLLGSACGSRVSQVGAIGFSGGGLATIWAHIRNRNALSLGAVAVNPPLDLEYVLGRAGSGASRSSCTIPRAINVTWPFYPIAGVLFGGVGAESGALLVHDGERNKGAAIGAGIGAAAGLVAVGLLDLWGDGSPNGNTSNNCIATTAIFNHFGDLMERRWKTVFPRTGVPERAAIFKAYVNQPRSQYQDAKVSPRSATPETLYKAYQDGSPAAGSHLLVVSSEDDPVVGVEPVREFHDLFAGVPDVQVVIPRHGGHASAILLNQAYARKAIHDFWQAGLKAAPNGSPTPVQPVIPVKPTNTPAAGGSMPRLAP